MVILIVFMGAALTRFLAELELFAAVVDKTVMLLSPSTTLLWVLLSLVF